ncbi:hypothetical protein [Erwinia typographi]
MIESMFEEADMWLVKDE